MAEVLQQIPYVQYTANGATTVFAYAFEVPTAADMVVYADGVVVPASAYTLAGVGVQAGGTVTFLVAPVNGTRVLLNREIALQRATGYATLGDFRAAVVNPDFNRLWMAMQGLDAERGGAIRVPYPLQLNELPDPVNFPGYYIGVDGAGQPTYLTAPSGTPGALASDLANSSDPVKGDALIGVKRTETNAVARTLHFYVQHSKLQVSNFCDPSSDTAGQVATGLAAAIAAAKAGGKALEFEPAATYTTNAETAFLGTANLRGLRFWGNGCTIYRNTGAGPVASLDSGGTTSRCDDIEFTDFVLKGQAASTYGLYTRGLVRSIARARAYDISTAGFKTDWSVLSDHRFIVSDNIDTFTVNPAKGLIVDQSSAGLYSAANKYFVIMEGPITDTGVELVNAGLGNIFTGTCENIPRGLNALSTSATNILDSMDFEGNTVYDVQAQGNGLCMRDCNIQSAGSTGSLVVASTAQNTTIQGGYCRWAALNNSSKTTRFFGGMISDGVTVGITNPASGAVASGVHQAYGVVKVNGSLVPTSLYHDVYEPTGTWTPAYTSAGGGAQGATTNADGHYSLVGRLCFIHGFISIAKGTLGAGAIAITGLPFASRNQTNFYAYITMSEWETINLGAGYTHLTGRIAPSTSTMSLLVSGVSVASKSTVLADFPDPMRLRFSGVYEIEP